MKITRIEIYPLQAQLEEPFGWSQRWTDQRATVVVKIMTDDGCTGWGETSDVDALRRLAPLLIGENPLRTEALWNKLYLASYQDHAFAGPNMSAISAFDIALWDLRGQATGQPLHALLGGALHDKITVYATGLYYRADDFPDKLSAEAMGYAEAGFSGMKMKVGGQTVRQDIRRVRHLRQLLGPDINLMIDANEAYDARTASYVAQTLADCDLAWFEEPCGSYADAANLEVRRNAPMAISGGESLKSRWDFAPRLANRVFDIIQPDIIYAGGISELIKIAHMANAFGVKLNPHFWGTGISLAATLHVVATLPPQTPSVQPEPYVNLPVVELDSTPHPIRAELTDPVFRQVNSQLTLPQQPGLGVSINTEILQRYAASAPLVISAGTSLPSHGR